MFEIDLKKSAEREPNVEMPEGDPGVAGPSTFIPIAGVVAVLVFALYLASAAHDRALAAKRTELTRLETVVAAQRLELAEASGKRRAMFGSLQEEVFWSDVLRMFSERTPDKMWVSQVKVVTVGGEKAGEKGGEKMPLSRVLSVDGGVLSSKSEANLDLIGAYVDSLQQDPRYQKVFGAATLRSVTRANDDPLSLVFSLTVPFRPAT